MPRTSPCRRLWRDRPPFAPKPSSAVACAVPRHPGPPLPRPRLRPRPRPALPEPARTANASAFLALAPAPGRAPRLRPPPPPPAAPPALLRPAARPSSCRADKVARDGQRAPPAAPPPPPSLSLRAPQTPPPSPPPRPRPAPPPAAPPRLCCRNTPGGVCRRQTGGSAPLTAPPPATGTVVGLSSRRLAGHLSFTPRQPPHGAVTMRSAAGNRVSHRRNTDVIPT
jgi:hypothetical protein